MVRNMLAVLGHFHAMLGIVRRISGAEHRLNRIVLDEFFERVVGLRTASRLRETVPPLRNQVAYGHHFHIRVILEPECRPELAEAISHQTDADLSIRHGLPPFGCFGGSLCNRFEALNRFAILVNDLIRAEAGPDPAPLSQFFSSNPPSYHHITPVLLTYPFPFLHK